VPKKEQKGKIYTLCGLPFSVPQNTRKGLGMQKEMSFEDYRTEKLACV
jgi:hypothetical protein